MNKYLYGERQRRFHFLVAVASISICCHVSNGWISSYPNDRARAHLDNYRIKASNFPLNNDKKAKIANCDSSRIDDDDDDGFRIDSQAERSEVDGQWPLLSQIQVNNKQIRTNDNKGSRKKPKDFIERSKTRIKAKPLPIYFTSTSNSFQQRPASASYSSLLPPIRPSELYPTDKKQANGDGSQTSSGLSSWEDFLGVSVADATHKRSFPKETALRSSDTSAISMDLLNSTGRQSLFVTAKGKPNNRTKTRLRANAQHRQQRQASLDGVLPVSDLFYRSPGHESPNDSYKKQDTQLIDGVLPVSDLFYRSGSNNTDRIIAGGQAGDATATTGKRISGRPKRGASSNQQPTLPLSFDPSLSTSKKQRDRKVVRRGMEMLVGGVSINADPPQRSLELSYQADSDDWASVITLNTLDFGPFLHADSVKKMSQLERAIYCEHWVHAAIKWKVCPSDLQEIVESHTLRHAEAKKGVSGIDTAKNSDDTIMLSGTEFANAEQQQSVRESQEVKIGTWFPHEMDLESFFRNVEQHFLEDTTKSRAIVDTGRELPKGFGKLAVQDRKALKKCQKNELFEARFGLSNKFSVAREDLVSGLKQDGISPIENVYLKAFLMMIGELEDFHALLTNFTLTDQGDGVTAINAEFSVSNLRLMTGTEMQRRLKRMGAAFEAATDSGYFQILVARAAKSETGWSERVRNQVVNECLLADDDLDESEDDYVLKDMTTKNYSIGERNEVTNGVWNQTEDDGRFSVQSPSNATQAPYGGRLGSQLLHAVVEHAKEHQPKVIAIGDVHGCADELQDLLRECDYRPGDLVVLLGDLVCKGPSSIAVVEMSREIGAVAICGNHDFEMRRWQKAIDSGVERPAIGTEHFHIATRLSKACLAWVTNLPWYISSKELGALFVHAGFVSGIRLAKQNPRLMTNMRSILPDGTVTSKFFNNWPWARLWDGPQTVYFGHDADRGLQQYEHAIGLDTGCVYGGRLTACILPEKRLVSVSARREYFKYRRKHYD
ncbi:hypothetical protein MPSEU_000515800 [Mayamaea pseudoterrestris]|nr:hypothetical protein MPSEU_000515800 [Mayamaea pseudoterrestris]